MKLQSLRVVQPVRVIQNTLRRGGDYLMVKAVDGKLLHIGRPAYIKRVLRKRFNVEIA